MVSVEKLKTLVISFVLVVYSVIPVDRIVKRDFDIGIMEEPDDCFDVIQVEVVVDVDYSVTDITNEENQEENEEKTSEVMVLEVDNGIYDEQIVVVYTVNEAIIIVGMSKLQDSKIINKET